MKNPATDRTFRLELWRSSLAGVIEAAASTFFLLIAVRWFHAGAFAKGFLSSANSLGYIAAPLVIWATRRWKWENTAAASLLFSLSGIILALGLSVQHELSFILSATAAGMLAASAIPLLTSIYERNYPSSSRGKLLSRCFMVRIGFSMLSSYLAGSFLNIRMDLWWLLMLVFVFCYLLSGVLVRYYPGHRLSTQPLAGMREAFRSAKTDILFRNTLISWMFLGFGNLMMQPLRVEFLANPRYAVSLSTGEIALYCGVIPNAVRMLVNPFWGFLFDKINFFYLRMILNLGFLSGIGAFFCGTSESGFFIGAVIFGIAASGGDVAWNLWVTKFAPPEKVPGYMAVHTFFTGVRGVIAPITGFMLLNYISMQSLSWFAMSLIGISIVLLLLEIRKGSSLQQTEFVE